MIDTLTGALGLDMADAAFWMPLAMVALLFVVTVAGVVLDGFDIGVGCLLPFAAERHRSRMLGLLSPWRDANELWLLLGLGLLVGAFPHAWGPVMGAMYLPLSLLGVGVLLRSASFEFRLRSPQEWQRVWLIAFSLGSWMTAASHGLILSKAVTAFASGVVYDALGLYFALCALASYSLLGAAWLVMREPGALREQALRWARLLVRIVAAGVVAVSLILFLANTGVFLKWGSLPDPALVLGVWGVLLFCFITLEMLLPRLSGDSARLTALPFVLVLLIFIIVLSGLIYSFFPYLVLDDVTIWDAVGSIASLRLVFYASLVALPVALVFNIWVYWGMFGRSRPPEAPEFAA